MPNSDSLFAQLERLTETFPQSKLQAAVEQRDAITPLLLEELHQMAADPAAMEQLPEDYIRHIYVIYLLAQFREQAAYEPLLTFLSTPGELVMDMMQDVVTEDLGRILASIFAGDLAPIKALIENPGANEWVRSGALDTLGVLYCEGQLPRDEYQAYLHELFTHRIERKHSHLWATVVIAASDMRAVELLPEIQRAFDDELVDLFVIDFPGAKELTQRETDDIGELWLTGAKGLIGPIVEEIGWWACFNEADDALDELPEAIPEVAFEPSNGKTETVYSEPKVGRNDSCPCGSGKKYKKCCLG